MKRWVLLIGVAIVLAACSEPTSVTVSEWYALEEIDGSPLPFGHGMSATASGRILFQEDGTCVRQVTSVGSSAGPGVENDYEVNCRWSGGRRTIDIVWDDSDPSVPTGSRSIGTVAGDRLFLPIGYLDEVFWTEVYRSRR